MITGILKIYFWITVISSQRSMRSRQTFSPTVPSYQFVSILISTQHCNLHNTILQLTVKW